MGCEGAIIHRDLENRGGRTPKTLVFSRFSAWVGLRGSCGAQAKGRVRRGSRDLLYLGEVSAEAKAAYSVYLGEAVPSGPSKTSLASA